MFLQIGKTNVVEVWYVGSMIAAVKAVSFTHIHTYRHIHIHTYTWIYVRRTHDSCCEGGKFLLPLTYTWRYVCREQTYAYTHGDMYVGSMIAAFKAITFTHIHM